MSHASEDKEDFVRPLAIALRNFGLRVWYDEFSLKLGDSLSQSIDRGLASCCFGVVVLSPAFFAKRWPQRELAGLVAREVDEGQVILLVWHGVSHQEVMTFSPTLADSVAVNTSNVGALTVALQILQRVRIDLYLEHSREDLERIAGEDILAALQGEIDETRDELQQARDELSEFQCPVCGAKLAYGNLVVYENDDCRIDHYECGYETEEGSMSRPCPYHPEYPNPEDYDLSTTEAHGEFLCWANGKTYMAQLVTVFPGRGRTADEAEADIHRRLPRKRELPRRRR
ncbi:MAG: toll/interleukin-1 receptor domain-containing protein [Phycisphaerales bacterium]